MTLKLLTIHKTDTWNAGLGMYITETTTLVAQYEYTSLNNGSGSGIDTYGGTIESFFAMGDGGLKASANFGRSYVSNRDDVDTYGLGATYYLGSNIGIGLNWEQGEQAGYEVNQYGVSAEWFISENFAVTWPIAISLLTTLREYTPPQDSRTFRSGMKLHMKNSL